MFKSLLTRTAFVFLFSVLISSSAFAQLCGFAPYGPCPTTVTPAPTTTTPTTTTSPTATTTTITTPGGTRVTTTTTSIPGYTNKSYSAGKTVGYIIAPFAAVAATYFLSGHHQIEISPNAGFFWPKDNDVTHMRDEGYYSFKALAKATDNIQVEGNFAYLNHFESRTAPTTLDQAFGIKPTTVHGLIYDINGVYNFGERPLFGSGVMPYVLAGVGGLSTLLENGSVALLGGRAYTTDPVTGQPVLDLHRKVFVADNSAFFTVTYGGGVKANKLWGPMGARADVRGRTFPNFRGNSMTWLEATAGVTFTFGE